MKVKLRAIMGDTDSLYLSSDCDLTPIQAEEIGRQINIEMKKHLPSPMDFAFEAFCKRILVLEKKRYAALLLNSKNEYKMKNRGTEIQRRDWCSLTGKTMQTCLDLILKDGDVDGAINHARCIIDRVKNFTVDDIELLDDLSLTRTYHKSAEAYSNKPPHMKLIERMKARGDQLPGLGDRISYYIMSGREPFADRAETLEFIKEHDRFIDTDYYINKQIIPPLERIFDALKIDMMTGKKIKVAADLFSFASVEGEGDAVAEVEPIISNLANSKGKSGRKVTLFDF